MNENPLPNRCPKKREDEKARSKTNRKDFKCLIEQLNDCVSDVKLNNNNTLEISVAMIKLNTFYNSKDNNITPNDSVSIEQFLKISNSVGIGFLQSGVIVYATEQLVDYFKDIKYLIGCPLSKISYNSAEIKKHVFVDNHTNFLLQIKRNYRSKKTLDIFITGKVMYSSHSEMMFLGYSKIKPFVMFKNPPLSLTGCYIVISSELEVLKCHPYIDYLLNTKMKHTAAVQYPHPDDMTTEPDFFTELATKGFIQSVVRVIRMEDDGKYKYVHCIFNTNIIKDMNGATKIVSVVWPYALSDDGSNFSVNDIELINMNPVWSAGINYHTKKFFKAVDHTEGISGESSSEDGQYSSVYSADPPTISNHEVVDALKGGKRKQSQRGRSASRANSNVTQNQLSGKGVKVKNQSHSIIDEKKDDIIGHIVSRVQDRPDAGPSAGNRNRQDLKFDSSVNDSVNKISSYCATNKSSIVNVKVGANDTMMKNDTLIPAISSQVLNLQDVSIQPPGSSTLEPNLVPTTGSVKAHLIPTIKPKLEMYEIIPQNISVIGDNPDYMTTQSSQIQPTPFSLQTLLHHNDRTSQLEYAPLTQPTTPCSIEPQLSSQNDEGIQEGDLTFDPPLEIYQIMNDFWSEGDLF